MEIHVESNDGYKLIRQVDIEPVAIKLESRLIFT